MTKKERLKYLEGRLIDRIAGDDLDDSPTHVVLGTLAELEYRIEELEREQDHAAEVDRRTKEGL